MRKLKTKWTELLSRILSYWITASFVEFDIKYLCYNAQKSYTYVKQIWPAYEMFDAYNVSKIISYKANLEFQEARELLITLTVQ